MGEAEIRRWHERRRADRTNNKMLGLIKGILSDGDVSEADARSLNAWVAENPGAAHTWPGAVLARRLRLIFADGEVTQDERDDLRSLLRLTIGNDDEEWDRQTALRTPTRLPLDEPEPSVKFMGKV